MILEAAVVIAIAYAIYKHFGKAAIAADVKTAVSNAEKLVANSVSATGIIANIKADLAKYL